MAARTIRLQGDHEELYSFFKELLQDVNFVILHEEQLGDGFHIVAVNKKRTSQLTTALLSLIGGFILRRRTGIELFAQERDGVLTAELRCAPYLGSLDIEVAAESQEERDMCRRLVELFGDKILEGLNQSP